MTAADAHPELKPAPVPLLEPREGIPPVVASPDALAATVAAFAAGTGPVAIDAERASGYRYGQRAYLIQLRRDGAGTALVDPAALPDLHALGNAIADAEWVLHAASQDLPCLDEVGMRPRRLFDTELAGRLAGLPRVGLGPIVENLLGLSLEKGHSAVDWSTRPLPEPWLRYAALDVEVLVDLRNALAAELDRQGKLGWALEEFAAIAAAPAHPPRTDPWRRTSGMHRVRKRRQLAVVRSLWETRDRIARERDISPGRVLPDAAIVEAAVALPASREAMSELPAYAGRSTRRHVGTWYGAVQRAMALPESALPPTSLPTDGPPPARAWADKDPAAAARLAAARTAVGEVSEEHTVPVENLLAPDILRRLVWRPPADLSATALGTALHGYGARRWQIELTAEPLSAALRTLEQPGVARAARRRPPARGNGALQADAG